jgi:hypothetical protein
MIVKFADVGSAGWNADMPAHDLPEQPLAWSSVQNMAFRAGLAERVQGYAAGFDTTPTQTALGLFAVAKAAGTSYLISCGTNKVFDVTGTTENEITGTSTPASTADLKWSGGELTGFLVLNETTILPQFIAVESLGGATNLADLTNWPASTYCKVLRPFKYYLVAGGMTESSTYYPYKVRWSTAAVPGTLPASWTATTSNDAGSVDLSANYGPIIDMVPFGNSLIIYRARGMTEMRWIGGTDATNRLVMSFTDVPAGTTTGILGLNCVVDVAGLGHVVLSQSDVYIFDGTQTRSVLDNRTRDWLRENIDSTYAKRAFVLNNADRNEVWVCFPESAQTACTKAIIFNYKDNTIGLRDLPSVHCGIHAPLSEGTALTWAGLSGTWDTLSQGSWDNFASASQFRKTVLGGAALYIVGNGTTANGTAMSSQLERQYIALGDNQRVKFIRSVWPKFEAPTAGQEFTIQIGTAMSSDEAITWQAAQTYTYGTSRKVDVSRAGRYMGIRVSCNDGPWRLRSMDVDVQPQGLW